MQDVFSIEIVHAPVKVCSAPVLADADQQNQVLQDQNSIYFCFDWQLSRFHMVRACAADGHDILHTGKLRIC